MADFPLDPSLFYQIPQSAGTIYAVGTTTLVSGTSGPIYNANLMAADKIILQRVSANSSTTLGEFSYVISGTNFTITSLTLDTPGDTQTGDLSTVAYFLVRQN